MPSTTRTKAAPAKPAARPRRKAGEAKASAEISHDRRALGMAAAIGFCAAIVLSVLVSRLDVPVPFGPSPFAGVAAEAADLAGRVDSPSRGRECLALADSIEAFVARVERGEFATLEDLLPALRAANAAAIPAASVAAWSPFGAGVGSILERLHEARKLATPQDAAAALPEVAKGLRQAAAATKA